MKRSDAVKFCERPETAKFGGVMPWAYCFTTHNREWRQNPEIFRKEDGRFDYLLDELGINPIHRGGSIIASGAVRQQKAEKERKIENKAEMLQISLFDYL